MFCDVAMPEAHPMLEFSGILLRNAEVRHKPARDGLHTVPVVYLELKSTGGPVARTCHAEQPFTDATRQQAEALAKTLTKGRVVTIRTRAADMSVTFPHINSVLLTQEQPSA